jgi:myo-inositol-1-phosphate synthase
MIPGMGAVATTFVAGVEAIRKGLAKPIGSLTQMGTVRLGKRTDGRSPKIKEFVPLAGLDDLVFTGWDIFEDNMYEAASNAGVLDQRLLDQLKPFLSSVTPQEYRWAEREEGQDQDGSGRTVARRHSRLQEEQRSKPADHDVVRFDGVLHRADRGAPISEVV